MRHAIVGAAIAAAVCLVTPARPGAARVVAQNLSRAEIRSLPIEARPNRPIHLYGNAVRRRQQRAIPAAPARPLPARPAPGR